MKNAENVEGGVITKQGNRLIVKNNNPFSWCSNDVLSQIYAFLKDNRNIVELDLGERIDDLNLCNLVLNITNNITWLDIGGSWIGDVGINVLATDLPNLVYLNIAGSSKISSSGLHVIADGFAKLLDLNIKGCRYGKECAIEIATKHSNLTHFNVAHLGLYTGDGVKISKKCSNLSHFDISGNPLHPGDVLQIVKNCPSLVKLDISYTGTDLPEIEDIVNLDHCDIEIVDANSIAGELCFLLQQKKKGMIDDKSMSEKVKEILFKNAIEQERTKLDDNLKHIIKFPEKYFFLINSQHEGYNRPLSKLII